MVSEKLDKMYSEIRESVNSEENIIDKIEKLIGSHFHFVENNIDFCDLLIRGESSIMSDGATNLRNKLIADYLKHIDFVENIMSLGIDTKTLKTMVPRTMANALLGIIRSFIYEWMLTYHDALLSAKVNCVLDIFLTGVRVEAKE
jgi:hypothetical protein